MTRILLAKIAAAMLIATASLMAVQSAKADFINGDNLRLYCASQDPADDTICVVYITGAVDAFTTAELIAKKTIDADPSICLPDGAGPDELKTVVQKWMERPEANLDFAATLVILGAVQNAYSC